MSGRTPAGSSVEGREVCLAWSLAGLAGDGSGGVVE